MSGSSKTGSISDSDSFQLTDPLSLITICTSDIEGLSDFVVEGLGMEIGDPLSVEEDQVTRLRKLWRISEHLTFEVYAAQYLSNPDSIQLRIIHIEDDLRFIHKAHDVMEVGPFSIGFPNKDFEKMDRRLLSSGTEAKTKVENGTLEDKHGVSIAFKERLYHAPEFLHVTNLELDDGTNGISNGSSKQKQTEDIGFSSFVTSNMEEDLTLFEKVLGLEVISDEFTKTSKNSSLGIEASLPYRLTILGKKNQNQGKILFMEFDEERRIESEVPPRLPNRGMVMWSFETKDIGSILSRAHANNVKIYSTPIKVKDPILGNVISLTLLTANGFVIEAYHKVQ